MTKPEILLNRWQSNDGTMLISRSQHDFVSHHDIVDNAEVFIDGGIGPYIRVSGNLTNCCLYDTDEDHAEVRELYLWTSYGKLGDEQPKTQPIKDLSSEHIKSILRTQLRLSTPVQSMFKRELTYRKLKKIND